MSKKKAKEVTSIATVVSLDGSSEDACRIVMLRTAGSLVIQTTLASVSRDGMRFIRTHGLKKMLDASGFLGIVESMTIGGKKND